MTDAALPGDVQVPGQQPNAGVLTQQVGVPDAAAQTSPPDAAQWQQALQAYYKQSQGQQPTAFYPAAAMAAHPYAGLWAGQPLMYAGAPYFGGVVPYGFPPAASAAPATGAGGAGLGEMSARQGDKAGAVAGAAKGTEHEGSKGSGGSRGSSDGSQSQGGAANNQEAGSATPYGAQGAQGLAAFAAQVGQHPAGVGGIPPDPTTWRPQPGHPGSGADLQQLAAAGVQGMPGGGPQDEREVKRQRRKQSNRESARRSRLRKQAECEALSHQVKELQAENARLKELQAENAHLKEANEQLTLQIQQLSASGGQMLPTVTDGEQLYAQSSAADGNLSPKKRKADELQPLEQNGMLPPLTQAQQAGGQP